MFQTEMQPVSELFKNELVTSDEVSLMNVDISKTHVCTVLYTVVDIIRRDVMKVR